MSSLRAVVERAVSSAVRTTASKVLAERSQRFFQELGNVVETAVEDSAKVSASAIIKAEDCLMNVMHPAEIEKSIVKSITTSSLGGEGDRGGERGASGAGADDAALIPDPQTPPFQTARSIRTEEQHQPTSSPEMITNPSFNALKTPSSNHHPHTTVGRVKRVYLTHLRPSSSVSRRKVDAALGRFLRNQERQELRLWRRPGERRESFSLKKSGAASFDPMDTRGEISVVCSRPPKMAQSSSSRHLPRSSGYLPLEKFSKKSMPNKRFDGFMTEPRRPPRTPPREDGSGGLIMTARSFPHRSTPTGQQVSTPVKSHPEMADVHTLSTSTIALDDNNLYPCPPGVVIFPAPKIISLGEPTAVAPAPAAPAAGLIAAGIKVDSAFRKPKID